MPSDSADIIIIGAGLTGLTLAYLLRDRNLNIQLLEARGRPGGRIHTETTDSGATIEMGATWLGNKHTRLQALIKELNLGIFEQQLGNRAIYEPISSSPAQWVELPPNSDPSFRVQGGTSALIHALMKSVPNIPIHFNQVVQKVQKEKELLVLETDSSIFRANVVVSTLPPYLLTRLILFSPPLSPEIVGLMKQTHTWMGESIKFGLEYREPFWREAGRSGTVFSNVGPVTELYDHSNYEDNRYGLKGFLNSSFSSLSPAERQGRVLNQLRKYYGSVVDSFLTYSEKVWSEDIHTFAPYERAVFPHQNNGNPSYQKIQMNDHLILAGSETASEFPGYMDGAVRSAEWAYDYIINQKQPF